MKQGKCNRVLPRKRTGHSKHPLPTTQEKTLHGHHQMVNTEIRLIIFFAANDGETLYQGKLTLEPSADLNLSLFSLPLSLPLLMATMVRVVL